MIILRGTNVPYYEPRLCSRHLSSSGCLHSLVVWPWTSHGTSLLLSFLIHKIRIIFIELLQALSELMNIKFGTVYNTKLVLYIIIKSSFINIIHVYKNNIVFNSRLYKYWMWDIQKIPKWQGILLCPESWRDSLRLDKIVQKAVPDFAGHSRVLFIDSAHIITRNCCGKYTYNSELTKFLIF